MGRRPGADRTQESKEWNSSPGKRSAQLRNRYGISLEEYDQMLAEQGGVCALCSETCSTGTNLSVDHDHVTGYVRGLLCRRCNTALGREEEFPNWLEKAIAYLQEAAAVV